VLDVLKKYGAKATFFVLGDNASRNPSLLARAVAEGHELGNHTYKHIKMTGNSTDAVCAEIEKTNAAIVAATGRSPRVMRPPYGATNSQLVNLMYNNYGMKSILWNVDTNDWQRPGVNVVVNRAVNGAKPGSIILLHDIHSSTAAAVEGIVKGLQARGYQLVTVSELIEMGRAAAAPVAPAAPAAPAAQPVPEVQPVTTPAEQALPAVEPVEEIFTEGSATLSCAEI
jgi:peptidoglycan/xylan/chitin deacetylase (PgdA/CDA1 family)